METNVKFDFHGKNFVVVGASSGMGRQIALELAEAGAGVLAIARNQERLEKLQQEYPELITTAQIDVMSAKTEDWKGCLSDFAKAHGKISGGVYTAGINKPTPLQMYSEETARAIFETSFWGMVHFLQAATRIRVAEKGSSYVVFSSLAAHCGNRGGFAYSCAKASVQMAARVFAREIVRDGHRINSISPGWVKTPLTADEALANERMEAAFNSPLCLGMGNPEDVSGTVLFLLSNRGKWFTGSDILVDGGALYSGDIGG